MTEARRPPVVEPYDSGLLDVGDGHQVYWETVGDPDGTPALWLHGGPGSGSAPGVGGLFDASTYRAVLLDQRGSGRSVAPRDPAHPDDPVLTDLSANTTDHLVADLERLREHLGIDRWVLAGRSWGVTLALVYAQRHPDRVRALVLSAVTSGDADEIAWITRGVGRVWPREWEVFTSLVPDVDPVDPFGIPAGYARLLADRDPAVREHAALAWCTWEDTHMSLAPGSQPDLQVAPAAFRMTFARLVTHYWGHGCFLTPAEVLRGMDRLAGLPGVLIHGRLDVSGPLSTAWALHRAWPGSELVVLEDTGHGGAAMTSALVGALDRLVEARGAVGPSPAALRPGGADRCSRRLAGYSLAMSDDKIVAKDLVTTLKDGQKGYAEAADKLTESNRPEWAQTMNRFAQQRGLFAQEIVDMGHAYGDDVDESGSAAAAAHRGWLALKDTVTGDDPSGVLDAAVQGEDHSVKAYEDALKQDLSEGFRTVVQRQHAEVAAARDEVKGLQTAS